MDTTELHDAADDMAEWAADHAADAGRHPTLTEVRAPSPRQIAEAVARYAAVQAMGAAS